MIEHVANFVLNEQSEARADGILYGAFQLENCPARDYFSSTDYWFSKEHPNVALLFSPEPDANEKFNEIAKQKRTPWRKFPILLE